MTVLYGAQQGIRALHSEAYANHKAKEAQYHLKAGGMYLNQAGTHLQHGRLYAWKGTIDQARAIRRTSDAAAGCKIATIVLVPAHAGEEDE